MKPRWPRMAFEHLLSVSAACAVERLATGSGVLTTRRGIESPLAQRVTSAAGHFLRRRNMELLMGVVIWLVLVGGLLALFSDDGRGE